MICFGGRGVKICRKIQGRQGSCRYRRRWCRARECGKWENIFYLDKNIKTIHYKLPKTYKFSFSLSHTIYNTYQQTGHKSEPYSVHPIFHIISSNQLLSDHLSYLNRLRTRYTEQRSGNNHNNQYSTPKLLVHWNRYQRRNIQYHGRLRRRWLVQGNKEKVYESRL